MVPSRLKAKVVLERLSFIHHMLNNVRALPLDSLEVFTADQNTPAAAESYLRRGLEALLDLGRHMLAKGFGRAPVEYKGIALELKEVGVLNQDEAALMLMLAGYRNRVVHFYYEIRIDELYGICSDHLVDVETILNALIKWIQEHPDRIDHAL